MEIKVFNANTKNNVFYEVDFDDTYEKISKLFSVPIDYIKNNNPGGLYKGKILFLPKTNFVCYVVKPFDTLQKIANNFGTTTEDLRQKNNLENDYVFIGQKIYV